MGEFFLKILNMSIAASWLILAVILFRFLLRRAPKWVVVLLWGLVALRLVVPFSFESALSLIPSAETFSAHNIQYETPAIQSGIPAVNRAINPILSETFAPNSGDSVNPLYVWTFLFSFLWLAGFAAMLLYAAISFARVRRSVAEGVPYGGNIFLCDQVHAPFILGLIRPRIYLPSHMEPDAVEPVIAHERAHLARRDHWWKPLGFLILAVHWFNPLCWAAYALLCRDIELACDEKVIRQMDLDGKKRYSSALLTCSAGRRPVSVCPLAFGEVGVKERVKNVLNYKKPAFWIVVLAVIACMVVAVCFATNPKQDPQTVQARITGVEDRAFLVTPVDEALERSFTQLFRVPIENLPPSPEPQVGDLVEITYDGSVIQGNPARFGTVYRMRVVPQETASETDDLRAKYPEYFDLETSKGLEVYVWQMSENNYRFGLMPGTNRDKTWEEKVALNGATAQEMALILSTYEIEDEHIFVIPWQNPISSYLVTQEEASDPEYTRSIRAMLGLDISSVPSAEDADTAGETETNAWSEEDTAIRQAILEHNRPAYPTGLVSCASFTALASLSATPLSGDSVHKITYYGWALYEEYRVTDAGLESVHGSHIPVALSFDLDERGYTLTEYWEPRDGSYYAQDIREKFPPHIAEDGMDSQKFILRQKQECYAQAAAVAGLDTDRVIGSLLETVCSSPAQSSNPANYIEAHPIEYRELTYYGRYTLKYCFNEFLKGGQTDLRGQILRALLDDLAPEAQLRLYTETGQDYFDAWKDAALSVREQHDAEWIESNQPAIDLLLSMIGEG